MKECASEVLRVLDPDVVTSLVQFVYVELGNHRDAYISTIIVGCFVIFDIKIVPRVDWCSFSQCFCVGDGLKIYY